MSCRSWRLIYH